MALRHLARRYQSPDMEIGELDAEIRRLCAEANPALLAAKGVCPDTASVLLVAAGDNPGRMKSERSLAALCGAGPCRHHQDRPFGIGSSGEATAKPITRCGGSLPPGCEPALPPSNGCGWLFTTREDARLIVRRSICASTRRLGRGPAGLWPSAARANYSQSTMWRSGWARSGGSTTTSHCIQLCCGLYASD